MGLQDAVFVAVTAPYHALHKTSSFAWNAASSCILFFIYMNGFKLSVLYLLASFYIL
ncbi:hypothetical protein DMN91_012827 [Ooceraea biroi]|uniref:Uncharacterized protein n=1 Tax=Ooceraea biroi TaxID=2015173 RepID=A0A3L8D3H9_OOCBI|nr:hypothetical protein DMN91_012827 [Ooceraea biroi]